MKNYTLILLSVMTSTMMAMSDSPMMMWFLMEISNMLFIMVFTLMQIKNLNTSALLMLVQFFSSSMVLMGIIEMNNTLMSVGIMVKLGLFPAHSWFPMLIYTSPWKLNLLTMTIPKIPPFMLMMNISNPNLILMSIIMSSMMMTIKLTKVNNIKIIMGMSSILHSGWMVLAQMMSFKSWATYFTMYTINTFMICKMMSMNMMDAQSNHNTMMKLAMMSMMFSLLGTPPLTMFIGKLYLSHLITISTTATLASLIMASAISIMYYSRILMKMIFMVKKTSKITPPMPHKMNMTWILYMMLLLMII